MSSLVVAPVAVPVLRLGLRIAHLLERQTAGSCRARVIGQRWRRFGAGRQAADIRDQLPNLLRAERGKGGHLGAANAIADVEKHLAISVAAREDAAGQAGSASGAVARLAGLCVELGAGRDGGAVSGQRIPFVFRSMLREKDQSEKESLHRLFRRD